MNEVVNNTPVSMPAAARQAAEERCSHCGKGNEDDEVVTIFHSPNASICNLCVAKAQAGMIQAGRQALDFLRQAAFLKSLADQGVSGAAAEKADDGDTRAAEPGADNSEGG